MIRIETLADPTRRRIVECLAVSDLCAGEIASQVKISRPAASQHLKALKQAQLVQVRAKAQQRIYSIAPEGFDEIAEWLDTIRSFWSSRLDKLEASLADSATAEN